MISSSFLASVFTTLILANLFLFTFGTALIPNSQPQDKRQPQLDHEFQIKVGQQVTISGADLKLKFARVSEDSRCPVDVTCVWAGNAEVALDFIENQCTTVLTLNTHSSQKTEGALKGYRVKLLKLEPAPHSERKIAPSDYVATLLITKE